VVVRAQGAVHLFFFVTTTRVEQRASTAKPEAQSGNFKVSTDRGLENASPQLRFIVHTFQKMEGVDERTIAQSMLEHLPKALFVLLPLFAFALKLVYIRSGRFYVEHLVFALHNHAFYFLVLTATTFIPEAIGNFAAFLWCVVYSVLALKRNYAQGLVKTLLKGCMLGCGYSILLGFALLGAVFLGAMNMPEPPAATPSKTPTKPNAPKGTSAPKVKAAESNAKPPVAGQQASP
jgi:hypothetical protein